MQRFLFSDGKSNKFWEITVEGESFTVRYGRVGTQGQTSTKTFESPEKARAEADKLIASKVKKGYVNAESEDEDGDDDADDDSVASAGDAAAALEAAIYADPTDLDAWQAYGDWLQERGDPRGELVLLDVQAQRNRRSGLSLAELQPILARRDELLAEHREEWLGDVVMNALNEEAEPEVLELEWRFGYLHSATLRAAYGSDVSVLEVLDALLELESFKFIHELKFGIIEFDCETDFAYVMFPLSKVGKLPSLRRLTIGEFDSEEQEISWVEVGDFDKMWPVVPNLEYLKLRGGGIELGAIDHPKLRALHLETAGLTGSAVRSLAAAKLPALETLEAWLGNEERSFEHGDHGSVEDLAPLLTGAGVPKLVHLALKNGDYHDELAVALCTAPIVAQLETLDLSMGTMSDEGARALLAHAEHFEHLQQIDLDWNWISDELEAELVERFGERVDIGYQNHDDDDDRYIAISE